MEVQRSDNNKNDRLGRLGPICYDVLVDVPSSNSSGLPLSTDSDLVKECLIILLGGVFPPRIQPNLS